MTMDELMTIVKEAWETDDVAVRTANAVRITDAITENYAALDAKDAEIASLNNKIDDLRRVNSELYSRVTKTEEEQKEDEEEVDEIEAVLEQYS